MKGVSKESQDLIKEKLKRLNQIIPECFSDGLLDLEKLQKVLGQTLDGTDEKYTFSWAGRNEAFKTIQTPSRGTLIPDIARSVNFNETNNVFIEGDNLEALKLLQKSYFERVKVIYIDPPYNTGKDFIYRDDFKNSIKAYLDQTGQSEDGIRLTTNPETNGRFHSDWLSMIYPRLYIARNLLRGDGLIFVSIDDKELSNLRIVMNEIFGEENFVISIIWKKRSEPPNDQTIAATHEYIVCYAKNLDVMKLYRKERTEKQLSRYRNPDNHPKGPWTPGDLMANIKGGRFVKSLSFPIVNPNTGEEHYPSSGGNWRFNREKIHELISNNEIYFGEDGKGRPKLKRFLSEVREGIPFPSLWDDGIYSKKGTAEIAELFGSVNIFDTPKPTGLIKKILELATSPNSEDLVLDFFAGSGTTAHAVLEKNREDGGNRQFMCIQLQEPIDKESEAYKGGYRTISEIFTERLKKVIKKIQSENKEKIDLGFKVFKLDKSHFKVWEGYEGKDTKALKEQMKLFEFALVSDYKEQNVIYECIVKEGLSLNSKVEKLPIKSNSVYRVSDIDRAFYISLDKNIKDDTLEKLALAKDNIFICIDAALNDSKKSNLSKQCNLKTI